MPDDLVIPEGWSKTTLGAIGRWGSGGTPKRGVSGYYSGSIPWLKIADINDGVVTEAEETITEEGLRNSSAKLVNPGTLLVAMYGSIGKLGIAGTQCATNQAIAFCVPDPALATSSFLFQLLLYLRPVLIGEGKGGNQSNISQTVLKALEVPLPPIEVQNELVRQLKIISEYQSAATAHIEAARRSIERFCQSLLAAACSGRLTADWRESHGGVLPGLDHAKSRRPKHLRPLSSFDLDEIPETWSWVQVEDLIPSGGIFDGPFGSNLKSSDYTPAGARVVRLENIGHLRFIDSKKTYVSASKYRALSKHAVYPGDIVFSSFVEEQIRVCVLPNNLDSETIAKADCFTLRPAEQVDTQYLALQLASPSSYKFLAGDIHGATRPRVNTTQVRGLPIRLCPLDEQREIVRRFNQLTDLAAALQQQIIAGQQKVASLPQAVLVKAFRGELLES